MNKMIRSSIKRKTLMCNRKESGMHDLPQEKLCYFIIQQCGFSEA